MVLPPLRRATACAAWERERRCAASILTEQDAVSLRAVGALFGGIVSASAALGKNLMGAATR